MSFVNVKPSQTGSNAPVERIRIRVLLPLTLAILFLLGTFAACTISMQRQNEARDSAIASKETEALFREELSHSEALMRSTLHLLMDDAKLRTAFERRDRATLLKLGTPTLNDLTELHGITHFYFHAPDRTNFLRLHEPDHFGDKIERATLAEAQRTGQPATGIERGPLGLFVLRTVMPWHSQGRLIGYVELGREVTNIAQDMHGLLHVEVVISVYKKFLERKQWEKSKRQLGHNISWDQFPTTVVVDKTPAEIPEGINEYLKRAPSVENPAPLHLSHGNQNLLVTFLPLRDMKGRALGNMIVARDITESVVAERRSTLMATVLSLGVGSALWLSFYVFLGRVEHQLSEGRHRLEEINHSLSDEVSERTKAEVLLRKAKQEADDANQAKSEFLSRISHELRTPLNAILGFGQLLEAQDLNVRQTRAVTNILKGGRHLLNLVNEVLDITGVESGKMEMASDTVRVHELLSQALDFLRPLAANKGINLHYEAQATGAPRYVQADEQRLKQVLLNLLSNAIKYNRPDGSVRVAYTPQANGRLRISVSDTGYGITPGNIAKLFMPFERLGADLKQIEGTGLGLVLSKRLIEAMQGNIGIESVPGEGSTFYIELLEVQPSGAESAAPLVVVETEGPDSHSISCSAGTILAIEDNAPNYWLLEEIIESKMGLKLLGAIQGSLGLELARRHHPDLILLDLHLPDMHGQDVLTALQADPETRHIPVIIMSADATSETIDRLSGQGIQAYITKPLNVQEFTRVVQEAMQVEAV